MKWQIPRNRPPRKASPSSRGRGLKYFLQVVIISLHRSPSSRGRGLKFPRRAIRHGYCWVALFTRAWIEMPESCTAALYSAVALFTRAWIEITRQAAQLKQHRSPSSRGRGLKYEAVCQACSTRAVALFTRAWIEILRHADYA